MDDETKKIHREILAASDSDPEGALDRISRLTDHRLSEHPRILFAKFNALRRLSTDRLYRAGLADGAADTRSDIEPYFGPAEIAHAEEALRTVAAIERADADYMRRNDFIGPFVDRVCIPLEMMNPGSVKRLLGWTKLSYFGVHRTRVFGSLAERFPRELQDVAFNQRFTIEGDATIVIAFGLAYEAGKGRGVEVMLLRRDPEEGETVGDVSLGRLQLFENGAPEFTPNT